MLGGGTLQQLRSNHNLRLTFSYRITFSVTAGLWQSTSSNYLYLLEGHRNSLVGLVQGIQGLFTTLASYPFGVVADRHRRDLVLKTSGTCGALALVFLAVAVLVPKRPLPGFEDWDIKFLLFLVGNILWGIMFAGNPIVESILADSVPTGGRSGIYTIIFFVSMLGRSVGPIVGAIVFLIAGNAWSTWTLGLTLLIALGVATVPITTLFFFNDNKSLGLESEAIRRQRSAESTPSRPALQTSHEDKGQEIGEHLDEPIISQKDRKLWLFKLEAIPYILTAADLVSGLASGCTIRFFPIFFQDAVKLSPVATNIVLAAQPIMIALCAYVGQHLSQLIGRSQVMVMWKVLGVSFITIMGLFPRLWSIPSLIVAIYLLRTGVNNATYPLQKSILMDYVPKNKRGKWGAFDSFTQFGWSGSAFVGGLLIDRVGFDTCFLITAAMQGISMLMLTPLIYLVPKVEKLNVRASSVEAPLLEEADEDDEEALISTLQSVASQKSFRDPEAALVGSSLGYQHTLSPRRVSGDASSSTLADRHQEGLLNGDISESQDDSSSRSHHSRQI